ncbi:aldo-keto reductase AKR2E4-like [Melitaea cinxia]|uniref:aldo-keto reductase AKR2E4-like n=1 Tax=Melitaea cinxia TaxID=113334 RepID=UPI001E271209|nr:aldo-keto reductase AKR2E4-like [Melitaea cinxia]
MFYFCVIFTCLVFNALCDEFDGGKAPRIVLNDGNKIPAMGLGTFLGFDEHGVKKVGERESELPATWALNSGYRLFDTAPIYRNEDQIGLAVRNSGIPRDKVFIVTKLDTHEQRTVIPALKRSLKRLNMSYVDLFLIHFPIAFKPDSDEYDVVDYLDTWKGMEEAKRLGLTKSIGVCNFNMSQLVRLMANSEIKPAVLQVELNLNLAQNQLLNFARNHNITVMAYKPFGSLFSSSSEAPPPRTNDPILESLGKKYGKTAPQITIRYLIQRGVIPIPKSVHKERIEKNIDVFDFELTSDEMDTLDKFNKNYRTVWPSFWQDHPYYPFEQKDVPDPNIFHGGAKEE